MTDLPVFSPEFFAFISSNKDSDPDRLRLKFYGKSLGFDVDFAIVQIQSRKKTVGKLRRFINNDKILFPSTLAAEQASHEAVATFHASLVKEDSLLADMTAGLGIDVITMAKKCRRAVACEIDPLKASILRYNTRLLGITNLDIIEGDSIQWLTSGDIKYDYIFIDPARRGEGNRRTYNFHDCLPDIILTQHILLQKCSHLLIKASPLLDITQTVRDIIGIRSIRAICVNGECKEILIVSSQVKDGMKPVNHIYMEAVDLDDFGNIISNFGFSKETSFPPSHDSDSSMTPSSDGLQSSILYSGTKDLSYASDRDIKEGHYLYEPNAAVMKLSPWPELMKEYSGLRKFAASSHLFVSDRLYKDFPGRILRIVKLIDKKSRKALKGFPANVVVRNYPKSAQELRKELGVKEGSNLFIYGSRLTLPILLLAEKIKISETESCCQDYLTVVETQL